MNETPKRQRNDNGVSRKKIGRCREALRASRKLLGMRRSDIE
jgi:hypothetical protein